MSNMANRSIPYWISIENKNFLKLTIHLFFFQNTQILASIKSALENTAYSGFISLFLILYEFAQVSLNLPLIKRNDFNFLQFSSRFTLKEVKT